MRKRHVVSEVKKDPMHIHFVRPSLLLGKMDLSLLFDSFQTNLVVQMRYCHQFCAMMTPCHGVLLSHFRPPFRTHAVNEGPISTINTSLMAHGAAAASRAHQQKKKTYARYNNKQPLTVIRLCCHAGDGAVR